jgi:hypothetical protein
LNPTQVRNAIVYSGIDIPPGWLATVKDISCPASCSSGKIPVEVRVFTDELPGETSWTIADKKSIIADGSFGDSLEWYRTPLCLSKGKYYFTIMDTSGDGICCGYGRGEYALLVKGRPVASGGAFTYYEKTSFELK